MSSYAVTGMGQESRPTTAPAPARTVRMLEIGEAAPDFDLPGVDGRHHRLAEFADAQLLAVIFTCNHCPTAQAYEGRIRKLVTDYSVRGVAFVAISPNDPKAVRLDELGYTDLGDSFEDMKVRAKDHAFNFPYLYDGERQEVSRAYGPPATPAAYLFDTARKLRYVGRIDDSPREERVKKQDLRSAIESLLAGKTVAVSKTPTVGCSTKWSDKRESVVQAMNKLAEEPVTLETADEAAIRHLIANKTEHLRLLNVWATWCGPCVIEFPELVTMSRMYRHRGLELISVSSDDPDDRKKALAFLRKVQASNRNLLFETDQDTFVKTIDARWDGALPYTMLIRPGGEIVYRKQGPIDALELRREIVKQLGARE